MAFEQGLCQSILSWNLKSATHHSRPKLKVTQHLSITQQPVSVKLNPTPIVLALVPRMNLDFQRAGQANWMTNAEARASESPGCQQPSSEPLRRVICRVLTPQSSRVTFFLLCAT